MSVKVIAAYMVLASNDRDKLCNMVAEWSQVKKYELWGAPFVNDEGKGEGQEICQAMVRYK